MAPRTGDPLPRTCGGGGGGGATAAAAAAAAAAAVWLAAVGSVLVLVVVVFLWKVEQGNCLWCGCCNVADPPVAATAAAGPR